MRIQSLNHSHYQHQYHIVWGTKYRRPFLKEYVKPVLIASINKTLKKYPTLFIESINTDNDHVHIQIEIPPNIAVSSAVQVIKQVSISKESLSLFVKCTSRTASGVWDISLLLSDSMRHLYVNILNIKVEGSCHRSQGLNSNETAVKETP